MTRTRRNGQAMNSRVKVLAAAVGICGVLAMSVMTAVLGGSQAQAAGPVLTDKPSQTGAGQTITAQQVAPDKPWVTNAAPAPQAQPWQGQGWPANGWLGIGGRGGR
jgi:hypothetical protein